MPPSSGQNLPNLRCGLVTYEKLLMGMGNKLGNIKEKIPEKKKVVIL
jgi:hypothetical protein